MLPLALCWESTVGGGGSERASAVPPCEGGCGGPQLLPLVM